MIGKTRALSAVMVARFRFTAAEINLHEKVAQARRAGATWERIAEVLGVTRQAASSRFGGRRG